MLGGADLDFAGQVRVAMAFGGIQAVIALHPDADDTRTARSPPASGQGAPAQPPANNHISTPGGAQLLAATPGEQDTKSAADKRRVPILDPLAAELVAHKARTGRTDNALVFARTATTPFNPENDAPERAGSMGMA